MMTFKTPIPITSYETKTLADLFAGIGKHHQLDSADNHYELIMRTGSRGNDSPRYPVDE